MANKLEILVWTATLDCHGLEESKATFPKHYCAIWAESAHVCLKVALSTFSLEEAAPPLLGSWIDC